MLTPIFSTVLLSDAISKCYLPDSEGNINKEMPEGVTAKVINNTIQNMTFATNCVNDIWKALVDACNYDYDFDAFVLSVYNCDAISNNSITFEAARDYLLARGLI